MKKIIIFLGIALTMVACSEPESPREVLRLQRGENNPRNSEGDFITLKNGRILFIYTHFYGEDDADHAAAYLASRYSDDQGKTWSMEDKLEVQNDGKQNVHSVSLHRLKDGKIALFYLHRNSYSELIPVMRLSDDEGESWNPAKSCLTDTTAYCVMNNSRVLRTSSDRLMLPLAVHGQYIRKDGSLDIVNEARLVTLFSDDEGATWQRGNFAPNPEEEITQEPGLVELSDGRIMMYCRTFAGCQYKCYSSDGGQSWTPLEPSNIPSPCSPALIVPMPDSKDWLLVWNNNGKGERVDGRRTPQTLAISHDEGETWEHLTNIDDSPTGSYCYTAAHFVDRNHFLLAYCSVDSGPSLVDTKLLLLNRLWLEQQHSGK